MKIADILKRSVNKVTGTMKASRNSLPSGKTDKEARKAETETPETEEEKALEKVREIYAGFDRDHIWVFSSGQASQDFRGNPKYLFVYINRYRPDIRAYWICEKQETIDLIRSLGFEAYHSEEPAAQYLYERTGVMAAEQVKYAMPEGLKDMKYLNLWHGVGFKKVERSLVKGDLALPLAKKYVTRGTFYRDHQLVGVTCPTIEQEYITDMGTDPDHFIHTGYLRCEYQNNYDPVVTFEHDLRKVKGLPADTKLVVYAPTYRAKTGGAFAKAFPDYERLYNFCEAHNMLLIFKVHPLMEKETGFLKAWETYGNRPYFWFWDNQDDFYEIMDQMDLAIIDYSGITSDMVAMGVPHYIRYVFDYDEYMGTVSVHDNYFEKTTGKLCYSFDELLEAMSDFETRDESAEIERLMGELWTYAHGKDDFDRVIEAVLKFRVKERTFPDLYSFDVFDTLISRKVLDPLGIFFRVAEYMEQDGSYPRSLVSDYAFLRNSAERSVRETAQKTQNERGTDKTEVTLKEIIDRIAYVYHLDERQRDQLTEWECKAELENVVPCPEQIAMVKELAEKGEKVVLISDMYLPKEIITAMLSKADPLLAELPLFLSNEYGVLKTSQKLYFEVYKSFRPYYDFRKWIHYGDNEKADWVSARRFGISARRIEKPEFDTLQRQMVEKLHTYDSYLVAAMMARQCKDLYSEKDRFTFSLISLCFVPYIDWVLRDAAERGYQDLYFVSRDGHHLKRIADEIIRERGLQFRTKYIYASRRTWRIPSFVHEVDEGFWQAHGSFGNVETKEKLLEAMHLDEKTFAEFFPEINPDTIEFQDRVAFNALVDIFHASQPYRDYLVKTAAQEREIVRDYLLQEIDPKRSFAFVEYYGRGYSQDCLNRIWQDALQDEDAQVPFYYSRSVIPTTDTAVRHHFTVNNSRQYFIEGIFANMPYKSIEEYYRDGDVIKPVIVPIPYDHTFFDSMERILPMMAREYARLELLHPEDTDRMLYDFLFDYYMSSRTDPAVAEQMGRMIDSVALYGRKREFAPPLTDETLERFEAKEVARTSMRITSDFWMSYTRSKEDIKKRYNELFQVMPNEDLIQGRVLTPEEVETNRDSRARLEKIQDAAKIFAALYEAAVEEVRPENKILMITRRKEFVIGVAEGLPGLLEQQTGWKVTVMGDFRRPVEEQAKELAEARIVLLEDPNTMFSQIQLRPETRQIMLSRYGFTLYNKANAFDMFLKWKKALVHQMGENMIDVIQLPSGNQKEMYLRSYTYDRSAVTDMYGCCGTDAYFRPDRCRAAREKADTLFPEAAGKKLIVYVPDWRVRKDAPEWGELLDLELLKEQLGDGFAVIVNFKDTKSGGNYYNRIDIPGFSRSVETEMEERELLMAADIVVGDYRDIFFEAPLTGKPAFSTAYDYEDRITVLNMSINANRFEDFLFCPVIRNSYELAEKLRNLDAYDYGPMKKFRDTYLTYCDGHSVERTVEYVKKVISEQTDH